MMLPVCMTDIWNHGFLLPVCPLLCLCQSSQHAHDRASLVNLNPTPVASLVTTENQTTNRAKSDPPFLYLSYVQRNPNFVVALLPLLVSGICTPSSDFILTFTLSYMPQICVNHIIRSFKKFESMILLDLINSLVLNIIYTNFFDILKKLSSIMSHVIGVTI